MFLTITHLNFLRIRPFLAFVIIKKGILLYEVMLGSFCSLSDFELHLYKVNNECYMLKQSSDLFQI